jgi:hypothetical protein
MLNSLICFLELNKKQMIFTFCNCFGISASGYVLIQELIRMLNNDLNFFPFLMDLILLSPLIILIYYIAFVFFFG